ncbi:MAG: amidase [Burkholderiales bacterium]|nr:amidase [Burkholderiales bacterium]
MRDRDTATAAQLAAAVRAGEVSARELCDAAIARIERGDGAINAIVVRDFERAREQASGRDRAIARGETAGALLGVPMTVKESYNVAGLPTTWGLPPFRDYMPGVDAVLVQRLKAAGAVILGKSNVPPALADWQSSNPIHGTTLNPRDPTRTPGGSSGGGAAAVAAGFVPLELGSDIGGSIRVPAHFCGVFGHKPSFNLLPSRGHAFPGTDGAGIDLAVCGPLARCAADLDLSLDVLAGPDGDEANGYRLALPSPRVAGIDGLRVLLLDTHPLARADTATRDALHRLAGELVREGAQIEPASTLLPDLVASHKAYVTMLTTITSYGAPPDGRPVISAHEWIGLLHRRAAVRRQWRALFETIDVLLAPAFGTPAFPLTSEPDWRKRTLRLDGNATPFGDQLAWSGMATFAGLPATVAPIAKSPEGLPIGVQIIGAFLHDRTTIGVAQQIESLRA